MGEAKRRRAAAKAANEFAKIYRDWPEVAGPKPGAVTVVSFVHADDCAAVGTGIGCTCKPDVRFFKYPVQQ